MASTSRAAQQALTELEKSSADFDEQLAEAARFIGTTLDDLVPSGYGGKGYTKEQRSNGGHGKEEWLLKWLLKRLQAPKDEVPRRTVETWRLLLHLLRKVPVSIAGRILVERKFFAILRQTLEETLRRTEDHGQKMKEEKARVDPTTNDSNANDGTEESKKSRKRKRSSQVPMTTSTQSYDTPPLLDSVVRVVDFILDRTKHTNLDGNEGESQEFYVEYMRSALRASAEDAAKLLGSWLSLLKKSGIYHSTGRLSFFSYFIETWQLRNNDDNSLMYFSLYCTLPAFASLYGERKPLSDIRELIARNIIIPSKAANAENADSTMLIDLTRLVVISDPLNASHLFDIAIQTIQPQGSKRRRPADEAWLQTVFKTLFEAMPGIKAKQNAKAIQAMLASAIIHKVDLDLGLLRSVTTQLGFLEEEKTDWELVSSVIKINADVLVIPTTDKNLLQDVFARISRAEVQTLNDSGVHCPEEFRWSLSNGSGYGTLIRNVLIPLMEAFAKARDLTGFVQHWLRQQIEISEAFKSYQYVDYEENLDCARFKSVFGVWEDPELRDALKNCLENSLSPQQVTKLLEWLETQVSEYPGPVCVILQAISEAISREEFADTVHLKCYQVLIGTNPSDKLDDRYKWRAWEILSNTLAHASPTARDELATLWAHGEQPFDSLRHGAELLKQVNHLEDEDRSLPIDISETKSKLRSLGMWKFACAAYEIAKNGDKLHKLAKQLILDLLPSFHHVVKDYWETVSGENCGHKDFGGKDVILSLQKAVFVDHPKVLVLIYGDDKSSLQETLKSIFWISSAIHSKASFSRDSPRSDEVGFSSIWMSAMRNDTVLNNPAILDLMVDIMLDNATNLTNPLIKNSSHNALAVDALLQLPIHALHRKNRERILRGWFPLSGEILNNVHERTVESVIIDPSVLALRLKIMKFPMFYEGMQFQNLADIANALTKCKYHNTWINPVINLQLFKELAKSTIDFVFTNIDQPRNQTYIKEAIKYINKDNKKVDLESPDFRQSFLVLFSVVLQSISSNAAEVLQNNIMKEKEMPKFGVRLLDAIQSQLVQFFANFVAMKGAKSDLDIMIISMIDALDVAAGKDMKEDLRIRCEALTSMDKVVISPDLKARLKLFIAANAPEYVVNDYIQLSEADCTSVDGRKAIQAQARCTLSTVNNERKRAMLRTTLSADSDTDLNLGQLLAVREMILCIEDNRKTKASDDDADSSDNDVRDAPDLSAAYSLLCKQLQKAKGVRQFCLISEILVTILKKKARSITQWNIDSTVGAISMICSRHGPNLRSARASTIYLHICQLFQAVILSHRVKLEGRFHLVVQALQSLLRCLFIPLPHSSSKILKTYTPPPWLPANPTTPALNATHAVAFTRLITLICDPSVSSVTRAKHNALTSATDKAKRMAGQHMVFVLMSYVRLQLEMKMLPGMREKMTPGLYAIFDTTTVELRRSVSEGLDASGRAVFGVLYRDYLKFGKWKGS